MLHRDEEQFLGWIRKYAREIDREQVGPGDLAIWKFGRCYSHSAIVIDMPEVIHAVIKGGGVVRGNADRDEELRSLPVKYFTLFDHGPTLADCRAKFDNPLSKFPKVPDGR
jgi:hypothetical protein